MTDLITDYDYALPSELIAREPLVRRDASRLLVVDRRGGTWSHRTFSDLPELLQPGDLLILNETQVVPARLRGVRTKTGGKWEGLFLRESGSGEWRVIGQTRGKLEVGETITLIAPFETIRDSGLGEQQSSRSPLTPATISHSSTSPSAVERESLTRAVLATQEPKTLRLHLLEKGEGGEWVVRPEPTASTVELLQRYGEMPLPHYMEREASAADTERYQTTYAARPGAVAAPTAGLHFTPDLLRQLEERGIGTARVTLHVGLGTFRPVSVERLSEHTMHSEWCELPQETVVHIAETRQRGGRVVAVGTTSVRTMESFVREGELRAGTGETNLFIRPPFEFRVVDTLITNFHLPKSTLLVLVSTFAGRELILRAYEDAIRERYRFFSYGDAMLIL